MNNRFRYTIAVVLMLLSFTLVISQGDGDKSGELVSVKKVDFQKVKLPKELQYYLGDLVYVPSGSFTSGLTLGDSVVSSARRITVASFYIGKREVTVKQYREFYKDMVKTKGKDSAMQYYPDTLIFAKNLPYTFSEPMTTHYFSHPAYDEYPVVGVTYRQANAYCEWMTKKLSKVMEEHPEWQTKYPWASLRLPTEMEWEAAAFGVLGVDDRSPKYSWGNKLMETGKDQVDWLGNFGRITDEDGVQIKDYYEDGNFFMGKSISYKPNNLGVYNLSGNVSEWVMDVYRPHNLSEHFSTNPFRRDTTRSLIDTNGLDRRMDLIYSAEAVNKYVHKGGSYLDGPSRCIISNRNCLEPDSSRCDVGFRISMICVGSVTGK